MCSAEPGLSIACCLGIVVCPWLKGTFFPRRSRAVKRVIMTSSLAAVVDHRPEGHVYTEADWCLLWPTAGVPYLT